MLGRHKAQGGGEMGLAHTWRAEEDYVLTLLQEAHGGQLVDLALVNGGLEGEIEVVQGLLDGKPSRAWQKILCKRRQSTVYKGLHKVTV